MNRQTRERALRAFVAAILNSGLTPDEIKEVARAIKTDRSMAGQLVRMMDGIADNLRSTPEPKRVSTASAENPAVSEKKFLREALAVTLPKQDLIHRLQSYAQHPDWSPSPDSPTEAVLREFLKVAPKSSWEAALMALKAGPVEPDPYVDMILTRDKASNG